MFNSGKFCAGLLTMELKQMVAVDVKTLDRSNPVVRVSVTVDEENVIDSKDILVKVCKSLGLKDTSVELFSLFEGSDKILRRIKDVDDVDYPTPEISLRKWSFNSRFEKKIVDSDQIAAHLVFCEAQHDLESGKFSVSKDEEQKLEEYSDPAFTVAGQYVNTCHTIQDYFSIQVKNCQMCHGQESAQAGGKEQFVDIKISCDGIYLDTGQCGDSVCVPLHCISKWSVHHTRQLIQYHYSCADNDTIVSLATPQFLYILAATNEFVKELQSDNGEACFFSSMISTTPDGGTVWENAIFDPEKAKTCTVVFPVCLTSINLN